MIITISRQLGAGGAVVARRIAETLGWRVVDDELVDEIATRSGLTPAEVAVREEQAPGFLERLIRMLTKAAPEILAAPAENIPELEEERFVKVTESVVAEIARQDRVVVVGRAAPAVLVHEREALHFKIVAPLAWRVERVAQRNQKSLEAARAEVELSDRARARYHLQYYRRDWNDASLYQLVINVAALGLEQSVDTIVARVRAVWPKA